MNSDKEKMLSAVENFLKVYSLSEFSEIIQQAFSNILYKAVQKQFEQIRGNEQNEIQTTK